MNEDLQYHCSEIRINNQFLMDNGNDAIEYVCFLKENALKDSIYNSVKQIGIDGWICIRPSIVEQRLDFETVYRILIECRPVQTAKVYIPMYESALIPTDVHHCSYCGGYTHNDMRGHCLGCGGPRNDDYLER